MLDFQVLNSAEGVGQEQGSGKESVTSLLAIRVWTKPSFCFRQVSPFTCSFTCFRRGEAPSNWKCNDDSFEPKNNEQIETAAFFFLADLPT